MKEERVNLWEGLLESVANKSNKIVPTKTLLVLGGQEAGVQQFVDSIRSCNATSDDRRIKRKVLPPGFGSALGYTYVDVEDHEHGELLLRFKIYTICRTEAAFLVLLQDFLTTQNMHDIIACVLLDWKRPQSWLRELSFWIGHLKNVLSNLSKSHPHIASDLEHFTEHWSTYLRSFSDSPSAGPKVETIKHLAAMAPLAEGQFDDPLGIPIYCIAQNAEHMDALERQYGIKDPQFDFIQQVVRTVLLKHGGSLSYTNLLQKDTVSRPIRTIIKENLPSVYKELRQDNLDEPETMLRTEVFVPAGWDSWVKIKVLRDGFDPSEIAKRWDIDIAQKDTIEDAESVVSVYEGVLTELMKVRMEYEAPKEELVKSEDLDTILRRLEQKQHEVPDLNDETVVEEDQRDTHQPQIAQAHEPLMRSEDAMNVDEMDARLKSLKQRSTQNSSPATPTSNTPGTAGKSGIEKDEYVHAFFQNLLTRSNTAKAEAEANKQ